MARPKRNADCHADKMHYSKGFCDSCYQAHQRHLNPVRYKQYQDKSTAKPEYKAKNLIRALKKRASEYGLTWEEWQEIDNRKRNSLCEICGGPPSGAGCNRILHIDHDHSSGNFRGLLCHRCNTGLGSFRDNPDVLLAAASYLRERS